MPFEIKSDIHLEFALNDMLCFRFHVLSNCCSKLRTDNERRRFLIACHDRTHDIILISNRGGGIRAKWNDCLGFFFFQCFVKWIWNVVRSRSYVDVNKLAFYWSFFFFARFVLLHVFPLFLTEMQPIRRNVCRPLFGL